MSFALPFALLVLGGGLAWATSRKPGASASPSLPALPPSPSAAPPFAPTPLPPAPPPVLDQGQQLLTQYALDPGMPPDLAAQVARALSAEGDPAKLDEWAAKLDQLRFPRGAQALRAKASALRAVQNAGTALGQISQIIDGQRSPSPSGAAQIRNQAREVVTQAAQVATQQPAATEAAAAAARAAAAAAKAATTGNPADVQRAAQEAASAAASVVSPAAQQAANEAVAAAQTAVATGSPAAAAEAAAKAAEAASQVLADATKPATPFTIGRPPARAPAETDVDARARIAAQIAAADIRAKGCWKENRQLVKDFQRIVYPAAGEADGFYGPRVALAMAKYLPKVPAPCYWPKNAPDRARAQKDWERMVREANVSVGQLWMGG